MLRTARLIFMVLLAITAMDCATHNYRAPEKDRFASCHDYSKNHNLVVDLLLVDVIADPADTAFSTAFDLLALRLIWDHGNGWFSGASNMALTLASLAPFYHHRDYQSMLARMGDLDYNDAYSRYCEPHWVGIIKEALDE